MTKIIEGIKLIFVLFIMGTFVSIIGAMYAGVVMVGYIGYNFEKVKKYIKGGKA